MPLTTPAPYSDRVPRQTAPARTTRAPGAKVAATKAASTGAKTAGHPSPAALNVDRVVPSYVQVATQLRRQILGHQLRPGERLPAEGDLAAVFGVSRSTAREALRLLAAENLIETRRGVTGGTFIVHPDPRELETTIGTAVDLLLGADELTMAEVIEVWNSLEIPAAGHAAKRRTTTQAQELLDLSAPIAARTPVGEIMVQTTAFHHALLSAAGNRYLQILVQPLSHLAREEFMPTNDLRAFLLSANADHRRIAEAVVEKDAAAAVALMGKHMSARRPHRGGPA